MNLTEQLQVEINQELMKKPFSFDFSCSTRLLFGCGRLANAGEEARKFGKNALIVTMESMDSLGLLPRLLNILEDVGVKSTIWTQVKENPDVSDVDAAYDLLTQSNFDVIIALGGGSVMDTAKAMSVIGKSGKPAWDYVYSVAKRQVGTTIPVLAITTTSGTGSHMTGYAVISDYANGIKSTIVDGKVSPAVSIVDPELMLSLDPYLTACTGFDAFTHCFESYINSNASLVTDMLAEYAIPLIIEYLPRLTRESDSLEGRVNMALADTLGGILIRNSGTALPHSLGQPLSGKYPKIRHGESLAAVYPGFVERSWQGSVTKFSNLTKWIDKSAQNLPESEAAEMSPDVIKAFLKDIGLNIGLSDLGLKHEDICDTVIKSAVECPDTYVNPVVLDEKQIIQTYNGAF